MKDFRLYDITDFVMDEDFIRWVQLRDPSDNLFWEGWLEQNPSRHLIIAEARQIVQFVQLEQRPVDPEIIQTEIGLVLNILHQSKKNDLNEGDEKPRFKRFRLALLPAAAILLLIVITGIPRLKSPDKPQTPTATRQFATTNTEKTNSTDKTLSFDLPDGSRIGLAPGSRISYSDPFTTSSRDVYLSGEAFFSIAKNPAKPFRVISGDLITRVLGTSFTIRSFEQDTTISITVRTGKISVWSHASGKQDVDADGLIVTPNQRLVYHREIKKFVKILVEKPLFIVSDTVDHSMTYEDTPVEQVFDQLGKYYGINIVFDNELLSKCTVTADLANEPFYHKLDLICKAIGANYEIVDAQVVIQSSGCQ